jgi:hypothetical protein
LNGKAKGDYGWHVSTVICQSCWWWGSAGIVTFFLNVWKAERDLPDKAGKRGGVLTKLVDSAEKPRFLKVMIGTIRLQAVVQI